MKTKKLIIFGDSAFAEIAYEYFTHDSSYEVVAFTVDKEYLTKSDLFGLPIIPFEELEHTYPPEVYEMHIALVYNKLNRVRRAKYLAAKEKGYRLANYISSKCFIWPNVKLGDNVFIFEDNTIQPFVKIGSNNVFWSGNHIGHHTHIGHHNFLSSHVVISGFCEIGDSNFIGVHITRNVASGSLIKGTPNLPDDRKTWERLKIDKI
jgi:sugar O-acyltransferase (sialic acid O-acetyltransferase NeuD family)